ncbi:MAG TPA: pyridoxamine 5'-phosphate oxidase family protein [Desulfobacteraceae bacterium]|nr:pyridoxamine 5'-phosphate oxidase family protein [Desulfobacteraceae bacterium]
MTKSNSIRAAVELGARLRHIFVGTADAEGRPHLAAAGAIVLVPDERIAVDAWFCPGTVMNLERNPRISLVVWDQPRDSGYQLLGEVEKIEEQSFMDGYAPGMEDLKPSPQIERRLLVRVDKVIGFSHAPHSDLEE